MRPAYWARTQSSLKRLATYKVTLEKSSETFAAIGLIQVLYCCSGSSWASCSMHACHRLPPALSAPPAARLSLNPSLIRLAASVDSCHARKQSIVSSQGVIHTGFSPSEGHPS